MKEYAGAVMQVNRLREDALQTLAILAGPDPSIGRYIELAWLEGYWVTGCVGTADGVRLEPGHDDDCLDPAPGRIVGYRIIDGEHYVDRWPLAVVTDSEGRAQAQIWSTTV